MSGFTFNKPAGDAAKPGGFSLGGGFKFGATTAKKDEAPPMIALGLQSFSQPQAFRRANELQAFEQQIVNNQGLERTFYVPQTGTAAPASGFGYSFGAKPAAAVAVGNYAGNYAFDQLKPQQVDTFTALVDKLKATAFDTELIQKKLQQAEQLMDGVIERQNVLQKQANGLVDVQNIIKIEFFKRFQMLNYSADEHISALQNDASQALEAVQNVGNVLGLTREQAKIIGDKARQQEVQVVELLLASAK